VSKHYLKSQSCLFRILSNTNESLGVSNLILSGPKNSSLGLANDIERENLVNTHIERGDYDEALKIAGERDTLIFRAKKIQILYERGKKEEAKAEIAKVSEGDKKGKENLEARIIIDTITARLEMGNGEYKKARERLRTLYDAIKQTSYETYEYLGRDVVTALIECEKRGGGKTDLADYERDSNDLYSTIGGTRLQFSSMSVRNK
jgi:ATP/maltotriose-dependent transcriptional regulator MalT